MTAQIDKLEIVGFRGATKPLKIEFDIKRPVTLIFGENGTGKSTVVDAFDFICNGKYGSLEDRSFLGQKKSHIASYGQSVNSLSVKLSSGSNIWTANLQRIGPSTSPTNCPDARILRRSSVLKLINAEPKKRFEELRGFIAVPGIEKSEATLRAAIKEVNGDLNEAIRAVEQSNQSLEQLWDREGNLGTDALSWAKDESKKNLSRLQSVVTAAQSFLDATRDGINSIDLLNTSMEKRNETTKVFKKAKRELDKENSINSEQDSDLVILLKKAKNYIDTQHDTEVCPICEQTVDVKDLISRLGERLHSLSTMAILVSTVDASRKNLESANSIWKNNRKALCSNASRLASLINELRVFKLEFKSIDWNTFGSLSNYDTISDLVETEARLLVNRAIALRVDIEQCKEEDQKSINLQGAIKGYLSILSKNENSKLSLQAIHEKLIHLKKIIETRRKNYIDNILEEISDDVEILYKKMHPNEGIGKIRLFMKEKAIGSLEMDGNFQEKTKVPIQAYYSESHLDTLGICVFLALAYKFKTESTIVILDDVVTSVDSVHLDRFMTVLHEQAEIFNQLIVTTHYRPWRDRYRYARGPKANIQVLDLRRWSFASGIQTDAMKTFVNEIKECLLASPLDRQAIASKAGIQLENVLDFITLHYQCKLPRQTDPNYTLGVLWSGVTSKLAKQLRISYSQSNKDERIVTALKPILDKLMENTWIRNSEGCHFRKIPSEVSNGDIEEFGKRVIKLSKLLVCESCGCFPTRRPSGCYWECKCGGIHLYPLVEPGRSLGSISDEK